MKALEYLSMPELIVNHVEVRMEDKEMELYRKLERDLLLPFQDSDVDAANAAVLANKLLQIAGGSVYDEFKDVQRIHDEKLNALEDLIEAANQKPVLVFYGYQHEKERIKERFHVGEINTSEDIQNWNAGKIEAALCHPASTGHGLNLQHGGSTIVWFSPTWSLELYQQANARLWRQGQKQTVVIHHLITKDTIDERVMQVLGSKVASQDALVDAVRARLEEIIKEDKG